MSEILGFLKEYWVLITFFVGEIGALLIFASYVLEAVKCLLRNAILSVYDSCKEKKEITLYQLQNVNLIHARAEDYAKNHRETFDLVTARAVARFNILNELCIPLVKVDGHFVCMKGKNAQEEISEGNSLKLLNSKIIKTSEYFLPKEDSKRVLIVIKHFAECSKKYPRAYASIKKNPL